MIKNKKNTLYFQNIYCMIDHILIDERNYPTKGYLRGELD